MSQTECLPLPRLSKEEKAGISFYTDPELHDLFGIRIALTERSGGFSKGDHASLNLGMGVGDDEAAVLENRQKTLEVLGGDGCQLVVPSQVHGTNIVRIQTNKENCMGWAREAAFMGADGIIVQAPDVAAMLCFADCTPVIVVSPTGAFAVVHAGWRGAVAGICGKAVRELSEVEAQKSGDDPRDIAAGYNAYIGAHIGECCFEVGEEVARRFVETFGADVVLGDVASIGASPRVSLSAAIFEDLERQGMQKERIVDLDICTKCNPDIFFSYRATNGKCGRHGAVAFRKNVI